MAMLAKRLIGNEIFNKPSIVVLTKDDELYKSFYNLRSYLQVKSVKSSIVKKMDFSLWKPLAILQ